jgi:transcriptional regulator with XRE-family HTH domain
MSEAYESQLAALGALIRSQRRLANLSLRQLADLTTLSNPYLSQLERGMHQPSLRVLRLIGEALSIPYDTLLAQVGMADTATHSSDDDGVEAAVRADSKLSDDQKTALIAVYRSMIA